MWSNFDGKPYTRATWAQHVNALDARDMRWVKFLVMHNTSSPTIAQWLSYPEQQRIMNLQSYYEHSLGWHSGPHGFIPPRESAIDKNGICIYGFTDLEVRGVHASCFNSMSLGFEMVGEFNSSQFDEPPGSYVRDNAIFVFASIYNKLGLKPAPYIYATSGLHFHVDCKRDNHDCPGKFARNRSLLIQQIATEMVRQQGLPAPLPTPPAAPTAGSPEWVQASLNTLGYGPLVVDGVLGIKSQGAIKRFQAARGLMVDGIAGPITKREISAALEGAPAPPVVAAPKGAWQAGILMTEFAGPWDAIGDRTNGYTGKLIDSKVPAFALPFHFSAGEWDKVRLEVVREGKSVQGGLADIGPWTSVVGQDQYWVKSTRPRAESNSRTNGAGMDATPAVFDALGIAGASGSRSAHVDWRRMA